MSFVTVIMAGGSGKRFWPLSREYRAKQSLPLFSDKTLLQETIERILPLSDKIVVISSIKQKEYILADLRGHKNAAVIFEPSGRNTAPCIALALRYIEKKWGRGNKILVLPADHYISEPEKFRDCIKTGMNIISERKNNIGTIGIKPDRAETGYGYIKKADSIGSGIFSVANFEEKPNAQRAEMFLNSGQYLWNGGIFLFDQENMIEEFSTHNPDILEGVEKITDYDNISLESYNALRSISIDYAIMEKTKKPIFSVDGDFGWNDIGSWLSYYELLEKDAAGNAFKGKVNFIESSNNMVINHTDKPVFILKKEGLLLVITDDTTLVADLKDHQEVKKVTEFLEKSKIMNLL